MRSAEVERACGFLPEAGPPLAVAPPAVAAAAQLQLLLSRDQLCCCHGDVPFLRRRARGMERERGLISQPRFPTEITAHHNKATPPVVLGGPRVQGWTSPGRPAGPFHPWDSPTPQVFFANMEIEAQRG